MPSVARAAWLAVASVVAIPAISQAQPTRIARSGVTPAPGTGVFSGFDRAPSVSGGTVAFRGLYAGGEGVYTWTGGNPALVANSTTPIPGGGSFNVFWSPTLSGSTTVFAGGQAIGAPAFIPFRGVYAGTAFGIGTVADTSTPSPSGGGNFGGFAPPAVSGTAAAFFAGTPTAGGIYTRSTSGTGAVVKIADTTMTAPGLGGPFGNFQPPAISGSTVALIGGNPVGIGVYTAPAAGGALTTIATTNTIMPGSALPFRQFGGDPNGGPANAPGPSISGSVVAFAGSPNPTGPSLGIYATTGPGGQLARIADTTTPVPGSPGFLFTQFDPQVSLFGDDVVFVGRSGAGSGIYTNTSGSLTRVVGAGDVFDGHTVADLGIGKQSFDGASLTFWAGFTDGSSGIYVVPVPEPAGVLAVAVLGTGLIRLRRRSVAGRATSCGPQAAS